jgi:hypothetical protein
MQWAMALGAERSGGEGVEKNGKASRKQGKGATGIIGSGALLVPHPVLLLYSGKGPAGCFYCFVLPPLTCPFQFSMI